MNVTLAKTAADLMQSSAVPPSATDTTLPVMPTGVIHTDAPAQEHGANMPQDAFGATIMGMLDAKELAGTGVLMVVDVFGKGDDSRLHSLQRTIATLGKKDSVRDATLSWFYDQTNEGHDLRARYNALENSKVAEEIDERRAIKARQNHINLMLQQAVETMAGIDALRADGFDVEIEQVSGTSVRNCMARRHGEKRYKQFSIKALRSIPTLESIEGVKTADLLQQAKKAGNAKVETPNDKATATSPNGEVIEPTKIGATLKALDTTLVNYVDVKTGQFQGLSDNNRKELYLFWGLLNATLSDVEKAQADAVYKADAVQKADANAVLNTAAAAAAQLKALEAAKAVDVTPPAVALNNDLSLVAPVEAPVKKARKGKKAAA